MSEAVKITLSIDGKTAYADDGDTVLDACKKNGVAVPHLCFDGELETGGVCGLCLVEIDDVPEPVRSCEIKVKSDMRVRTRTPAVDEARQDNLKKVLQNHPADCGACPKGGNCAIQDVCCAYPQPQGISGKETAKIEHLSPLIDLRADKCIGCGKCLHFLKKAGVTLSKEDLPVRGFPKTELSGALTDVCPAGALTNATAKKLVRAWETVRVKSIDINDALCARVNIDTLDGEIVRVVPSDEQGVYGRLLSDKARFSFDGLRINRLDRPYTRVDGRLKECSWTEAFMTIASKIKTIEPDRIAGLAGDSADCESMLALRDLLRSVGAREIDGRGNEAYFDLKSRQSWLFNTPIDDFLNADAFLIVGADVKREAPVLNWYLTLNKAPKAYIGSKIKTTFPCVSLGDKPNAFEKTDEKAPFLKTAKHPVLIVGSSVTERPDAAALMDLIYKTAIKYNVITDTWNGYNFLHKKTSVVGALELGLVSFGLRERIENGEFDFVYLLNEDTVSRRNLKNAFVVYQGIFGSAAAQEADVVLPGVASTEKRATYVNFAGMAQSTTPAVPSFEFAREDWKILRALSEYAGATLLPYDDLDDIRDHLAGESVTFFNRGEIRPVENVPFGVSGFVQNTPIEIKDDFFDANEVCRQSPIMKALKKAFSRED